MVRVHFILYRLRTLAYFSFASIAVCMLIKHNIHIHFRDALDTRLTYLRPLNKADILSLRSLNLKINVNDSSQVKLNLTCDESFPFIDREIACRRSIVPIIPWSNRSLLSNFSKPRYLLFKPLITSSEHQRLLEIFQVFKKTAERFNLTYMLYGGSLLGSYRHHAVIPWDDDIDVLMNSSQKPDIVNTLNKVPGYNLCTPENMQWKFYKSDSGSRDHCSEHMWPYLDIFFFSENETHIWDNNEMYSYVYNFKKLTIFPLNVGIFEGDLVSVPHNKSAILQQSYNIDLCVNSVYSHKAEAVRKGALVSLPCKRLFYYFPFVFRTCEDHSIQEYLMDGQKPVYKISTSDQC